MNLNVLKSFSIYTCNRLVPNVGIVTPSPGQKLSGAGTIESTAGGIKFPDGSVQTAVATLAAIVEALVAAATTV